MKKALRKLRRHWLAIAISVVGIALLIYPGLFVALELRRDHLELYEDLRRKVEQEQALDQVVIPSIDFKQKPLGECVDLLVQTINELDPAPREWTFEFKELPSNRAVPRRRVFPPLDSAAVIPEPVDPTIPITLKMRSAPVREAMRYVCALVDAEFELEDFHFQIVPLAARGWTWESRGKRAMQAGAYQPVGKADAHGMVDLRPEMAVYGIELRSTFFLKLGA